MTINLLKDAVVLLQVHDLYTNEPFFPSIAAFAPTEPIR